MPWWLHQRAMEWVPAGASNRATGREDDGTQYLNRRCTARAGIRHASLIHMPHPCWSIPTAEPTLSRLMGFSKEAAGPLNALSLLSCCSTFDAIHAARSSAPAWTGYSSWIPVSLSRKVPSSGETGAETGRPQDPLLIPECPDDRCLDLTRRVMMTVSMLNWLWAHASDACMVPRDTGYTPG